VAVVVVLLDSWPCPFLEAAVQVKKVGWKICELSLPVWDVLFLDAKGLAAVDQIHKDLAADCNIHYRVDSRWVPVSAGDGLVARVRCRILWRE